jgi:hypothetical protein
MSQFSECFKTGAVTQKGDVAFFGRPMEGGQRILPPVMEWWKDFLFLAGMSVSMEDFTRSRKAAKNS